MVIKDQNSFFSGAFFIVIGAGTVFLSLGYKIGTPARMGSGFFPLCLGLILLGLGLALALQACAAGSERSELERWELKPLLVILVAIVVFAVMLIDFGLPLAIIALVVVSSLAATGIRWFTVACTAVALAGLCYLIFVVGLQLQIPVRPFFY